MTEITLFDTPVMLPCGAPSRELRLVAAGHSGNAALEQAGSALVRTLACTFAQMSCTQLHELRIEGVAGSGCCGVTAIPTAAGLDAAGGAFGAAASGLCQLARQYPGELDVRLRPRS